MWSDVAIKHLIYGITRRFSVDDLATLNRFTKSLDENLVGVVKTQIEQIVGVKHDAKGKLTQLHYEDGVREGLPRVSDRRIDIFAASVIFEGNRADLIFSEGLLVAIEYSPVPFQDDRRRNGVVLSLCELDGGGPETVDDRVPQVVSSMLRGVSIIEANPPVRELFQKNFAARFRCELPTEFLELIQVSDEFTTNSYVFYGTQSRTIPWPDRTFLVLAEHRELPVLLCIEDEKGVSEIQIANIEDESFVSIGTSFFNSLSILESYSVS